MAAASASIREYTERIKAKPEVTVREFMGEGFERSWGRVIGIRGATKNIETVQQVEEKRRLYHCMTMV